MKNSLNTISRLMLLAFSMFLLYSCAKDEDTPPVSTTDFSEGIFIVNEGLFPSGSGSVTWFKMDGSDRTPKLFEKSNNLLPLGNLAQSMTIINNDGFIVVNNANIIRAVSLKTFQQKGAIEGINLPRFIVNTGDGNAWVSSWDNKVFVFDPEALTVQGEVSTGTGPEKMMKVGEALWVLNQGGYSIDSTITIIDINARQVSQTVMVYPKPTGIQVDENGNVWVMCSGHGWNGWPASGDSRGHLVCIDPSDYSILVDLEFPETDQHPEKLEINAGGDELFYIYPGGIYKQSIASANLELAKIMNHANGFYSLDFDSKNDVIYATDAGDFQQDGWVYRFQTTGTLIDSLQAGVGPTDVCIGN
ncbi:MAG TPA: hypothetical protein P5514_07990 [Bacteroidales bacterium]|nr:hypothetical protein [Bacteroidales bacterium]HRX96871.1 hypothetical protein [Bacteroidales bacterium]